MCPGAPVLKILPVQPQRFSFLALGYLMWKSGLFYFSFGINDAEGELLQMVVL